MSELAKIEGNQIVIRIEVKNIVHGAPIAWNKQYGEDGSAELKIIDASQFAKDIVSEMNNEGTGREGDTLVDLMMDNAVIAATENGSVGLVE